jgi:hypothetical protein
LISTFLLQNMAKSCLFSLCKQSFWLSWNMTNWSYAIQLETHNAINWLSLSC